MSGERERPEQAAWELAEFVPPHASEDVPWDRPADMIWPEPELDALTWNERWNEAAYDPDYPLPPLVERAPARQAVAAAAGASARLRFGRPVRPPDDESDDPYDEYAPVADDLDAPGQLTWTGGSVPLRTVASADGAPVPARPPTVEPPTWSPTSRSVFGDYFAASPGQSAPSLPSPEPATVPPIARVAHTPDPAPKAAEEWPPIPTDFPPQWASVAPVQPAWSQAPSAKQSAPARPATVPPDPAARRPATPPRVAPSKPEASYIVTPRLTPSTVAGGTAAASLPAARPLPTVRPVTPPRVAPRPPAPILPDDYGDPGADAAMEAADAESEGAGPSTLSTLFWMAVTGVVVVGLVLAFLHFMTGVLR